MQALKGIVIIMSFAIAILMTLIVYGMYQKSQNPDFRFFNLGGETQPAAKIETSPQPPVSGEAPKSKASFGDISLALGPHARIVSAHAKNDRLVIVAAQGTDTTKQGGDLVVVIDLANGKILGRVKAGP